MKLKVLILNPQQSNGISSPNKMSLISQNSIDVDLKLQDFLFTIVKCSFNQ